ncbi:hypothetical protein FACS189459_4250 [Bacilli bacterium]|nr:hypothetical protein FACS189459_4250 [Bacilli bacterium]
MQQLGYDAIMINSNPETLSTDYDLSNKLFFEPITNEYVDNIIEKEKPYGVMIQFGGGTAINLAEHLSKKGVKLLGCSYESINNAEDRKVFNTILNDLNIPQAKGTTVFTNKQAIEVANKLSYPVLVRPSYVLGGQGMAIAYNDKELTYYIDNINSTKQTNPILIDKYLKGIEYEIDAITDGEDILIPAIMEQIELSGVHSGDSICVLPTIHLDEINKKQIITYAQKLAKQLKIIGIFNIQFVVYDKQVYVIEVNPRSSRTIPYVSKVTSIPIIDLAIDCIFGKKLSNLNYGTGLYKNGKLNYYGVKAPVFSFNKIKNSEVFLSPMMKSTGEVLGIDKNYHAAVLKAFASAGVNIENKTAIFISENRDNEFKNELVNKYKKAGFKIIEANSKEALTYVKQNKIGLLVNSMDEGKDFELRRTAIDYKITTFTSLYTADAYIGAVLFCNNKKITIVDIVNL